MPLDDAEREQGAARLARARSRSVFIATPIARHPVRQYTASLAKTFSHLLMLGIRGWNQNIVGFSNLPRARNELVASFLASDFTDIVFIDDDMGWRPEDLVRLLASDKQVIGGVGAKKRLLPDADPNKWCFLAERDEPLVQDEMGAVRVAGVGTGFLKIERGVFEAMVAAHPEWRRRGFENMPPASRARYHAFFRFEDDWEETGEDFMFCRSWREMGGSVWVDPTIRLTHVGEAEYTGDFSAMLEGVSRETG